MIQPEKLWESQQLNPQQREAIEHLHGPLLVLAGAGTGKTRVLTSRIVQLIQSKVAYPSQILAVTFTNKAAREMKERVENMLQEHIGSISMGTFHSVAARILRQYAEHIGFTGDFTIINRDDQLKLIKKILKQHNIDEAKHSPKLLLHFIGRFKDKAYMPRAVPTSMNKNFGSMSIISLYDEYQQELRALNAMDFDDLLLYNIQLFNENLQILEHFQHKFKHILVDEYQDTNVAQYIWLRLLAQAHNNICCVGDDDQSIYGWRGAEVTNILRFEEDFEGAKVVRLERNYRSTKCIIKAAAGVIAHNDSRHGKDIFSQGDHGELIKLSSYYDDKEEARNVADEIDSLVRYKSLQLNEIAILVRAGYQTRAFEESLNFLQIPYAVIGGMRFYERAEIKDVLSYIRLIVNPEDMLAFERIVNTPRRGIGQTSMQTFTVEVRKLNMPFFAAAKMVLENKHVKGKAAAALLKLIEQFEHWRSCLDKMQHAKLVEKMLHESDYLQMHKEEATDASKERLENIKELLENLNDYASLKEYMEHISLITDIENQDAANMISIMTIHAAKGLEFDTVFLPGWEEGVFPTQKTIDEGGNQAVEEERRLAYVAITRAKNRLFISYVGNRRMYGRYQSAIPSRFVEELPKGTYEIVNKYSQYYGKNTFGRYSGMQPNGMQQSAHPYPKFSNIQAQAKPTVREPIIVESQEEIVQCGTRVFHIKFGYGSVISQQGDLLVVSFEKAGLKKVLRDYLEIKQ